MKIARVACSGFRGIRDELCLEFPPGFVVLTGANGAGKSTICDIIEFALSGELRSRGDETERQERLSDYLWWRGSGRAREEYAAIWVVDEAGDETEIRRTRKGLVTPKLENQVRAITGRVSEAPYGPTAGVLESSIIRDEEITRLSIDLAESERYRFVSTAIGDSNLPKYAQALQRVCKILAAELLQVEQSYSSIRSKVSFYHEQIAEQQARSAAAGSARTAEEELRKLFVSSDSTNGLIEVVRQRTSELRLRAQKLARLESTIQEGEADRRESESASYRERGERLKASFEQIKGRVEQFERSLAEVENELSGRRTGAGEGQQLAALVDAGEKLGLQNGKCPLCGSMVREGDFANHLQLTRERVDRADEEFLSLSKRRTEEAENLQSAKAELLRIERELRSHRELEAVVEEREARVRREMEEMGLDVAEIRGSSLLGEAERTRQRIREIDEKVAVLEASNAVEALQSLEGRLSAARRESNALQLRMSAVSKAHGFAKSAVDAIRRIEGELIEERLARLGPLLEELYLRLRPHADWPHLRYHVRGDVRRFLSFTVGEGLNPRFLFSSGQKRAIGIAFLIGIYLANESSLLRTLILDDPVQHIDDFRALHLVELLGAIRKSGRQLVCTTEDQQLGELIARRLQGVENEDGALIGLEYEVGKGVSRSLYRRYSPIKERVSRSA